jgi:hypothetical protein
VKIAVPNRSVRLSSDHLRQQILILQCRLCSSEKPEVARAAKRTIKWMDRCLSFILRIVLHCFRTLCSSGIVYLTCHRPGELPASSLIAVFMNPFKCFINEMLLPIFSSLAQTSRPSPFSPWSSLRLSEQLLLACVQTFMPNQVRSRTSSHFQS